MNITNTDLHTCIESLDKCSRGLEPNKFLIPILLDMEFELNRLQRDDIREKSIAVRNIFELYLIYRYICDDVKKWDKWMGQSAKDLQDVCNAFYTWITECCSSRGIDIPSTVSTLRSIPESLDESLEDTTFIKSGKFELKTISAKYCTVSEYDSIHKLCSKFVHPSSMRVNGFTSSPDNSIDFCAVLDIVGTRYVDLVVNYTNNTIIPLFIKDSEHG